MVWGGISHGLKSQLVLIDCNLTTARYRDEILRPHVIPFLQQHNLTLQMDNARPYVARICWVFLANNNVQPLDWPPYSPDLSLIEHPWDQFDRKVWQCQPPHATRAQLTRALLTPLLINPQTYLSLQRIFLSLCIQNIAILWYILLQFFYFIETLYNHWSYNEVVQDEFSTV